MPHSKESQAHDPTLLARVARPRFLRAVPSLVVLTTAMAWAAAASAGGLDFDAAQRDRTESRAEQSGGSDEKLAGLSLRAPARIQAGGEAAAQAPQGDEEGLGE